jgi:hypothetical protein
MKAAIKVVRIIAVGLFAIFAHAPPAKALTLNVPYDESNYDFSVTGPGSGSLGFGPLVNVVNHGCPGFGCESSFWDDSFTISMFDQGGSLLATDTRSVEEICSPSGCSAPTLAFVTIAPGTAYFELSNDVSVGGGWTFNSASMTIENGSEYQISETPLPGALPLLATGLGGLAMFGWRRNRKRNRFARQEGR